MSTYRATAPGKIILAGEHAVVYGRPAIAVPVWEATAQASVTEVASGSGCTIVAHELNQTFPLNHALQANQHDTNPREPSQHDTNPCEANPLALVAHKTLVYIGVEQEPDWRIDLRSTIPIASGLGSGAAVSAAIIRAICGQAGVDIEDEAVSQLVFESETLHHGTPSGIDNTVIAYGMPVWYIKGEPPLPFERRVPLTIVIGDSGIVAPTKESVSDVRQGRKAQPEQYEAIFDQIGIIVTDVRTAIEEGDRQQLGQLFDQNQILLSDLDVSHSKLEKMIHAARNAGALGAKLSGGGRGGNMIAVVNEDSQEEVRQALLDAGARRVLVTTI